MENYKIPRNLRNLRKLQITRNYEKFEKNYEKFEKNYKIPRNLRKITKFREIPRNFW